MPDRYTLQDRATYFYRLIYLFLYKRHINKEGDPLAFHAVLVRALDGKEPSEEAKLKVFKECLLYLLSFLFTARAESLNLRRYLRGEERILDFIRGVIKQAWGNQWAIMFDEVMGYEREGFEKAQIRLANRIAKVLVGHEIKSLIWSFDVMTHVNEFCLTTVPAALKVTFAEEILDAKGLQELEAFLERQDELTKRQQLEEGQSTDQ